MASAARAASEGVKLHEVRHNVAGQRLGRKGQEARQRILSAALRLLEDPHGPPVTLTSVAREASMRLTNLYLYFPDMVELLLAVLGRVMDAADAAFIDRLSVRWPDERLGDACQEFLRAHYQFWKKHARLLHMRNALSDVEPRIMDYRQKASLPIIEGLIMQMDGIDDAEFSCSNLAVVVLTGFERMATVVTNPNFTNTSRGQMPMSEAEMIEQFILAEARLLELAIRDRRSARPDAAR